MTDLVQVAYGKIWCPKHQTFHSTEEAIGGILMVLAKDVLVRRAQAENTCVRDVQLGEPR